MTLTVPRHEGKDCWLNSLCQTLKARASCGYFEWRFQSNGTDASIEGVIGAPGDAGVGLRYYNLPGGLKYCLNSKIAYCTPRLTGCSGARTETLPTACRAAFEILTVETGHGVSILAAARRKKAHIQDM